jgi:tyrosine-protein phosphatase YwqE
MKEIGFTKIITTPHIITNIWDNNENTIIDKHIETSGLIKETIENNHFNVAAEYMLDSYFFKRLNTEKLLTLKDNYILIEMSYLSPPIQLYDIIFEIQLSGYKPILAHPERYTFYINNYKEFEKLKNSGCLFQLNLLSTVNYYGEIVGKQAEKLLKNNMYDFVGSDIHHENHIKAFERKIEIKSTKELEKVILMNSIFS